MQTTIARFPSAPRKADSGAWRIPMRVSAPLSAVKTALVTGAAAVFCGAVLSGAWYTIQILHNGSYRLATLFIAVIIASNVISKYAAWRIVATA